MHCATMHPCMDSARIVERLGPFLENDFLSAKQLTAVSAHLELLLKWNRNMNLTSLHSDDAIVSRHFGESLFSARKLRPLISPAASLVDLGSGAGFPGIPIKIWIPGLRVMLIEARQKKATFLNEVIRALRVDGIAVSNRRAEELETQADVVTLRAVEKFERVLPVAERLVRPGGKLVLLIGSQQTFLASSLLPRFAWQECHDIPLSSSRIVLIGQAPQ
jgi:16S rRNA (guanine527-N7)-methyltransferase